VKKFFSQFSMCSTHVDVYGWAWMLSSRVTGFVSSLELGVHGTLWLLKGLCWEGDYSTRAEGGRPPSRGCWGYMG
jgi:hypothetical protein